MVFNHVKKSFINFFNVKKDIEVINDSLSLIFKYGNSSSSREIFNFKLHGSLDEFYKSDYLDFELIIGFTNKRRYEQPYSEVVIFYKKVLIFKNNFNEENNNYIDLENKLYEIVTEFKKTQLLFSDCQINECSKVSKIIEERSVEDLKYLSFILNINNNTLARNIVKTQNPKNEYIEKEYFFMDGTFFLKETSGYTRSYLFFNYLNSNVTDNIIRTKMLGEVNRLDGMPEKFFDDKSLTTSCKYMSFGGGKEVDYQMVYESVIFNDEKTLFVYLLTKFDLQDGILIACENELSSFKKDFINNSRCLVRINLTDGFELHRFNGGRITNGDIDKFTKHFIKNFIVKYFASEELYDFLGADSSLPLSDESLEMLGLIDY